MRTLAGRSALLLALLAPALAHAQWTRIDTLGLPQNGIFSATAVVASDAAVHALAGFNPRRLYRSTDHGDTWALVAPVAAGDALHQAEATIVTHRPGVDLHVSTDEGLAWTSRPATSAPLTEYLAVVARAEVGATRGHAVIAASSARLHVTIDDFATTEPKLPDHTFFRVASNGSVFVATTGSGPGALYFRSTDAGQTWATSEASGLGSQFLYASRDSFFVSGFSMTSSERVLVASADGASWAEVALNPTLPSAPAQASSARHGTVVTFGQAPNLSTGIFASTASGRAPVNITGDFPRNPTGPLIPCVATGAFVATSSTHAYALAQCTRSGQAVLHALYRRAIPGSGSTSGEATSDAHGLSLGVPAPHPVAGVSRVSYTVGDAGPAVLAVFDVLGRHVLTLAEGAHAPGTHTAVLDAPHLAPGAYVLRLHAAGATVGRVVAVVR